MRRSARFVLLAGMVSLLGANLLAYRHAQLMTRWSQTGTRTPDPDKLGALAAIGIALWGVNIPRPVNDTTPTRFGLPFLTFNFPSASGSNIEAWYIPGLDEEPIVVAFHGYAASKARLLSVGRSLHASGYGVLLVDFYGSGGSSGNDTTLGVVEARDVAAALEYVRNIWPGRATVLYGFSMGAAAILRAIASEDAAPDAIILEASFDSLRSTARNRFRTLGLPEWPFADMLLFWGGTQWRFDPFSHNPVDYARSVACRTLLLHGAADARVSPEQASALQGAFHNQAELVIFADVPHAPIVEYQPEAWGEAIRGFLQQVRHASHDRSPSYASFGLLSTSR